MAKTDNPCSLKIAKATGSRWAHINIKLLYFSFRARTNYIEREGSRVLREDLVAAANAVFSGEFVRLLGKAMKNVFPNSKRSGCRKNGARVKCYLNLDRRTGSCSETAQSVEDIFRDLGYLVMEKTDDKVTAMLPTEFRLNGIRQCKEVTITGGQLSLEFGGINVPVGKVFKSERFDFENKVELKRVLTTVKSLRPCAGFEVFGDIDEDFTWCKDGQSLEESSKRKRGKGCEGLLYMAGRADKCTSCNSLRYALLKSQQEQEQSLLEEDVQLDQEDTDDLMEILKALQELDDSVLDEMQKEVIKSQLERAKVNPKQYRWSKR